MKYIEGQDRVQLMLLPDYIEEYISEENPVRVIDAFVEINRGNVKRKTEIFI